MESNKQMLLKAFYEYGRDILESKEYQLLGDFIQHGGITCRQHSIGVAVFALSFVWKYGINCDERSLVRGALLHDYFLYDWHETSLWHTWHGFSHAGTALKNAERDFELNEKEREIIRKHMWPLNPAFPAMREAWIVTMTDKYCSSLETLGQIPILNFLQDIVVKAAM